MKKETIIKVGSIAVLSTLLLGSSNLSLSKNNYVSAKNLNIYSTKEITVTYNGEKIEFDQSPIIDNGRTKVPFRKIFESMGTIVYYSNNEKSIIALTKNGDIITHKIGTTTATINGQERNYDSASQVVNDRTLVPVRMISDLLNAQVEWNEQKKEVNINKAEQTMDPVVKEVLMCVLDVNYNPEDTKRYIDYKRKNPSMDIKQVIIDVNMDMDREMVLYTDTNPTSRYFNFKHYDSKLEDRKEVKNPNDILVLVNRFNTISKNYEPNDLIDIMPSNKSSIKNLLREEAANKFFELKNAFINESGLPEYLSESLLSYKTHEHAKSDLQSIRYCAQNGYQGKFPLPQNGLELFAYTYSCEPEMNDSRTGLTVNFENHIIRLLIEYLENNYGISNHEISEFKSSRIALWNERDDLHNWLKNNSYRFGFIERYPNGKKNITKMEHIPWTYRYVGIDAATKMYNEGLCFEEYYAKYLNPTVNVNNYSIENETTQKILVKY